ncbi:pyridoxal-dependent decarboxylase, exosortase A system-associated [Paremcibacter congregatus]|uniref:Pyridoxal-dependent decarboxylase, exosortase A system-associated n=1 Tax=Paremcibacter congregatus TaxID=2043170 RepID=A0A2G4YUU4_9PROT|nr:pyridoxal-dependent decarboxylase, exosortase A system-associated [Paremcibacter congregatus]PHZ86057.1 pyridoxal-dependent decarboxylase, exosortase A system-associated [Paremcibacter congregatus]QDE27023.1 pyridoxal-dependent decarboxylase, exosortase A system-associated [Paremcibacter congregatus]
MAGLDKKKPEHMPITSFPVRDGELTVGGIKISQLANRVGSTPFYAYDRGLITERFQTLRDHMPADLKLHYAMKANPMPAVVQHMSRLVDGLDLASAGEMMTALDTGMAPDLISFAGPGKTEQELSQAIAAGVVINMESPLEMENIARIAKQQGVLAKVAIRVNPDFELKASGMKMGGGPKQFGVDAEAVPEMLSRLAELGLDFIGFHIYSGSQNLSVESLLDTQEKTLELAVRLTEAAPHAPRKVNIGGGLGIPYFPGDKPLDLKVLGAGLKNLMADFHKQLPDTEVVMELGRFMVGEAGLYVTKIIDKKVSRGEIYLIADGGMHHHLAASGNFGQMIRKNYPVAIGNRMDSSEKEQANVVGCLCTPLDRLGDKMLLPAAEVGDFVVLFQSGAYGLSASPTAFLGHAEPAEVLV